MGHSTVVIELDGVRLLTDPLLGSGVAHLRRHAPLVNESVFKAPDAVLISHLHHDHLDLASLRGLGYGTPLVVPAGAGGWLKRRGFDAVTELGVGESTGVGGIRIKAVEARHDGRRFAGPRVDALGYLAVGRRVVYFAGDTGVFAEMADFAPPPDVVLVPVAGWGPRVSEGHMDPSQAAQAVALMAPRVAIPVHWGALRRIGLSRAHRERLGRAPHSFAERVSDLAPGVEVRILTPGQETVL